MSNPPDSPQDQATASEQIPPRPELFSADDTVYSYTRKMALADSAQVDVSKMAAEAGFKCPVFVTDRVYAEYVNIPEGVTCQDEEGRLWDILTMLGHAIRNSAAGVNRIPFTLYVLNEEGKAPTLVTLHAACGALDIDDRRPAITIMLPNED